MRLLRRNETYVVPGCGTVDRRPVRVEGDERVRVTRPEKQVQELWTTSETDPVTCEREEWRCG